MTDTTKNTNSAPRALKHRRQAAWRERNPLKVWAHASLRSALRRGLITRQPCELCGAADTDAHHDTYHEPLTVRWLCRKHHKQVHAQEKQEKAA